MDRRAYLGGVGAVVAASTLAGCTGGDSDTDDDETQYGTLSTSVTDQPNDIDHFESLEVTIQGVWIKPADAEEAESEDDETADSDADETGDDTDEGDGEDAGDDEETGDDAEDEDGEEGEDIDQGSGRYYIEFDDPQTADLVGLQGDNTQLIDETEVEVGDYQFLQLDVTDVAGVLENSDEEPVVETPGNAPLQFKHDFEIRADEATRFIADFAPFQRGQGKYMIRPVATGTRVLYGDEEYTSGDDGADGGESDDDGGEHDDAETGSDDGDNDDESQDGDAAGNGN